jgi:hypothetical protein
VTTWLAAGHHRFKYPNYGSLVEYCPEDHLSPLPVKDANGTIYQPPCRHKGRFIGYIDVGTIIWLGAIYLEELVQEAASRLR